jgi:hypothetical protein
MYIVSINKLILITIVSFSSEASFLSLKTNLDVLLSIELRKNLLKHAPSQGVYKSIFSRCLVFVQKALLGPFTKINSAVEYFAFAPNSEILAQ